MRRRFWEDFLGRFWQKFCFDLASSPKNLRRSNDIKADVLSGSPKNVFPESATHSLPRIREDSWKMIWKFWYDLGWSDDKIPHNLLRSYFFLILIIFLRSWIHFWLDAQNGQSTALVGHCKLFIYHCSDFNSKILAVTLNTLHIVKLYLIHTVHLWREIPTSSKGNTSEGFKFSLNFEGASYPMKKYPAYTKIN